MKLQLDFLFHYHQHVVRQAHLNLKQDTYKYKEMILICVRTNSISNKMTYIFVEEDYSLYVSDSGNHLVMKWIKDEKEGIVLAGGNSLTQLYYPEGVIVDQFGQIYMADSDNDRVMYWYEGTKEVTIVVSGNGEGKQLNQFNQLKDLSFDR